MTAVRLDPANSQSIKEVHAKVAQTMKPTKNAVPKESGQRAVFPLQTQGREGVEVERFPKVKDVVGRREIFVYGDLQSRDRQRHALPADLPLQTVPMWRPLYGLRGLESR